MNRAAILRVAVLLAAAGLAGPQTPLRAAPPVAPSPEAVVADAAVMPAAHVEADRSGVTERNSPLGPVPLAPVAGPAAPPRAAAPRPLPDWRLLAALGAAFAAVAAYRVVGQRRPAALPPDVFELLGEASLGGQQSVRVVRFGPRTLLVAVSAAGVRTLAEVTDAQVTERIVSACHGADNGRGAAARGARRVQAGRGSPEARP
jgi:flagellar biogenesis protein FliO